MLLPLTSVLLFVGLSELVCRGLKLAPPQRPPFKFIVRDLEDDVEYPFMVEDPDLLWAPKPSFQGQASYHGAAVRINSAGFRDREYPLAKTPGVFRILCLGDSTTFGHRLPIDDTYHGLLEEMLNLPGHPSGLRYEVINGGVTGYSSAQCVAMYEHRGRNVHPDMVLLNVGTNDPRGRSHLSDAQLLSRWRPNVLRRIDDALSNLHSYRALHRCVSGSPGHSAQDGPKRVPRVNPEEYGRNVAKLDELCKADGCQLVLISFAYCPQLIRGYPANQGGLPVVLLYRQALEAAARERYIPVVSVPLLTTTPNPELFFDAFHPNRRGHLLLALALEQFLRDRGPVAEAGHPPSAAPDGSLRNEAIGDFLQERGYVPGAGQFPSAAPDGSLGVEGDQE
jgi:lysophospholipase L1-like esterase